MVVIIYTDGSYREIENVGAFYSGAAIIFADEDSKKPPDVLTTVGSDPKLLSYRNVSGELSAVIMACEHCMNTLKVKQTDRVVICHDYVGVANWCKKQGEEGYWKAKTPLTQYYRDFMNTKMKTRCQLQFMHVKGHSNTALNDLADTYAKKAIDTYIENGGNLHG